MDFLKILEDRLLDTYGKYMILKIYVNDSNPKLKEKYIEAAERHNMGLMNNIDFIDAGIDLYTPEKNYKDPPSRIIEDDNESIQTSSTPAPDTQEEIVGIYGKINKIDYRINCSAQIITKERSYNTGYYLYPRSSISKLKLRLANSVGIIDAGYRGNIMAMFDVTYKKMDILEDDEKENIFIGKPYDRYVQICGPNLDPIIMQVVNKFKDLGKQTERGKGGFGSTGR